MAIYHSHTRLSRPFADDNHMPRRLTFQCTENHANFFFREFLRHCSCDLECFLLLRASAVNGSAASVLDAIPSLCHIYSFLSDRARLDLEPIGSRGRPLLAGAQGNRRACARRRSIKALQASGLHRSRSHVPILQADSTALRPHLPPTTPCHPAVPLEPCGRR